MSWGQSVKKVLGTDEDEELISLTCHLSKRLCIHKMEEKRRVLTDLSIRPIYFDYCHNKKIVGSDTLDSMSACNFVLSDARDKVSTSTLITAPAVEHIRFWNSSTIPRLCFCLHLLYLRSKLLQWSDFCALTCIRQWSWRWCSLSPPPLWLAAGRHGWTRKAWCSPDGSWICYTAGWHWWILRYVL